jgi:L-amino acid N-acyltransferase YncA
VIRPGRPDDVVALTALRTAYRAELAAAGLADERESDWDSWVQRRIAAGDVRVATEHDAVVGYIVWEISRSVAGGRSLVVPELFVRRGERGQRHGAGLLARALDRARSDQVAEVELAVGLGDGAARALVASFGFTDRGGRLVLSVGVA